MLKIRRWFISALACALVAALPGAAGAATDPATAEAFMRKSGLWEQLSSIAPQVRSGFDEAATAAAGADKIDAARVGEIIDAAYAPARLRAVALASLQRDLDPRHVAELQRWFDSRLGQNITKMEEAVSTDDRDPRVGLGEGMALLADATPERRALLEELVLITKSAELMTSLHINTALAVQRGASSSAGGTAGAAGEEQLRAALEAQRPQLMQALAGVALASFARAYDTLPTAELGQYVTFSKSPAGRHFNDAGVAALDAALVDAATEFGRGLARARAPRT